MIIDDIVQICEAVERSMLLSLIIVWLELQFTLNSCGYYYHHLVSGKISYYINIYTTLQPKAYTLEPMYNTTECII